MRWRQGTPGDDGLGHQGATIWPSTPRAATLGDTIGWWLGTPLSGGRGHQRRRSWTPAAAMLMRSRGGGADALQVQGRGWGCMGMSYEERSGRGGAHQGPSFF
jgi:hypothetical protein